MPALGLERCPPLLTEQVLLPVQTSPGAVHPHGSPPAPLTLQIGSKPWAQAALLCSSHHAQVVFCFCDYFIASLT